jgi:cytoskeletal protein CcmA (bactofilin family)
MAQIIKHRRGSLSSIKDVTARVGELVMATGSIGDLNGPILFVGETEGVGGAYRPVSKIYQGSSAPSISIGSHGSTMDGTPFYASSDKSLYILNKDGNTKINLTGNIEGNTISGVTINALTASYISSSADISAINITASYFKGDGSGITNISLTGITGLELNMIKSGSYSGSISNLGGFQVNTDTAITGGLYANGTVYVDGTITDINNGGIYIDSANYSELSYSSESNYVVVNSLGAKVSSTVGDTNINSTNNVNITGSNQVKVYSDNDVTIEGFNGVNVSSYNNTNIDLNANDQVTLYGNNGVNVTSEFHVNPFGYGDMFLVEQSDTYVNNRFHVNGNSSFTGSMTVSNGAAVINSGLISQNSDLFLTSGSNLIIQNGGNLQVAGDASVSGALYVSGNIYQTGSFYTQGDIILSGSINIGDNIGVDTINFNGEVSSSILPKINAAFDLGSSGQTWNNIYGQYYYGDGSHLTNISMTGVTGLDFSKIYDGTATASINQTTGFQVNTKSAITGALNVDGSVGVSGSLSIADSGSTLNVVGNSFNQITLQSANGALLLNPGYGGVEVVGTDNHMKVNGYFQVGDYLQVSGNTSLTGSLQVGDTLKVTGSIYDDQLTDNRVLIAGPNGRIEDDGTFTYDGVTLKVGSFQIDEFYGDVRTSGSVQIGNGINLTGSLNQTGSQNIIGNVAVTGSLTTSNTTIIGSTTTIGGTALVVSGAVNITGSVNVTDNVTASYFTGSFVGNGSGLTNLSMTGVTGLDFSKIYTGSATASISDIYGFQVNKDSAFTGSVNISQDLHVSGSGFVSGGMKISGSVEIDSNLYVSGNLEVLGSATNVHLQSNTIELGDNIILVNAYSPFQRYAGIAGYDSGSVGNSGSLLWDSLNNYWNFVNGNGDSSKIIGTTTGSLGFETNLTSGTFPIASGNNTIENSLLTYSGTTLSFNTNKFTIDSSNGNTLIYGNVTLSDSGGLDAATYTSTIVFKNSSNVLGYVSSTDSNTVTTQLLGYKASDGSLTFSSVIDGGLY